VKVPVASADPASSTTETAYLPATGTANVQPATSCGPVPASASALAAIGEPSSATRTSACSERIALGRWATAAIVAPTRTLSAIPDSTDVVTSNAVPNRICPTGGRSAIARPGSPTDVLGTAPRPRTTNAVSTSTTNTTMADGSRKRARREIDASTPPVGPIGSAGERPDARGESSGTAPTDSGAHAFRGATEQASRRGGASTELPHALQ
jgi:hypothetical protein